MGECNMMVESYFMGPNWKIEMWKLGTYNKTTPKLNEFSLASKYCILFRSFVVVHIEVWCRNEHKKIWRVLLLTDVNWCGIKQQKNFNNIDRRIFPLLFSLHCQIIFILNSYYCFISYRHKIPLKIVIVPIAIKP